MASVERPVVRSVNTTGRPLSLPEILSVAMKMGTKVTIPETDVPRMQGPTDTLAYEVCTDTGFEDKLAFATGEAKFLEQASRQENLDKLLVEGNQFAAMLYTWRGLSIGLPTIDSNEQANRMEIHRTTAEILAPEVVKLNQFMLFEERATKQFCEEIGRLCQGQQSIFVSETYLLSLGEMINMFAVLDELTNVKSSVINDLTAYRRAASTSNTFDPELPLETLHKMTMHIPNHNRIIKTVKDTIGKINRFQEVLCSIIMTCVEMLESQLYMFTGEKHAMYKVIGFCLHLVDSDKFNINKQKSLQLSRIDKVLKQVEVVPLYGDMMIKPFRYVMDSANYDPTNWPSCNSSKSGPQGSMLQQLNAIREEFSQLLVQLAINCSNLQKVCELKSKLDKDFEEPRKDNRSYYELALRAVRSLSSWTSTVVEVFYWKLLHPADTSRMKLVEQPEEYEKATKYNYSDEEKLALIELISMIKSLAQILYDQESMLRPSITRFIYGQLQDLVQVQLREPLRKSIKHKHDLHKIILVGIRDITSDLIAGHDPTKDPILKGKKDSESGHKVQLASKQVTPSATQLYMCRTMLEQLIHKGISKNKNLEPQHVSAIEAFLKSSFMWKYISNLHSSITKASDLSQLWYREFFLEMTRGKRVQYPIEMSVPWILTKHILDMNNPRMIEYLLFALELYNDSYNYALNFFKKQYLVDEIEAEVNLVFDQLVYTLGQNIYSYYHQLASTIYLDRNLMKRDGNVTYPPDNRYTFIFKQNQIKILGREVNLRLLLAERFKGSVLAALDAVLNRFEASPLASIVEIAGMLDVVMLTHQLLCEYVNLGDFWMLFHEANQSVTRTYGRITLHAFDEVVSDLMPQYCYNTSVNRFVRTDLPFVEKVERERVPTIPSKLWGSKALATAFTTLYQKYGEFVGPQHLDALLRWINYQDVALILKELRHILNATVKEDIHPITETLRQMHPRRAKLPTQMSTVDLKSIFQAQLQPLISYPDLKTKVFQVFREIGNGLVFCLCLENALNRREVLELNLAGLFTNIIPKPFIEDIDGETKEARQDRYDTAVSKLTIKFRQYSVTAVADKYANEEQKKILKENLRLTKEKMCQGLTLFQTVLKDFRTNLDPDNVIWTGASVHTTPIEVNDNLEFHRLWSAIQFNICLPVGPNEFSVEALYGDSLQWAGITLLYLLGQHRRFEVMDFCYHMLKTHKPEPVKPAKKGVQAGGESAAQESAEKMVKRIKSTRSLNDDILSQLSKGFPEEDVAVKDYQPPGLPEGVTVVRL